MTNHDAQERLKETYKITGTKAAIFECLLDGAARRVQDVMAEVKCNNPNSFRVFCTALTSKGIMERLKDTDSGDKMLKLTDICFPLGRPTSAWWMNEIKSP